MGWSLPRSVRPGWPLRSKTTTSFSPARSQGLGRTESSGTDAPDPAEGLVIQPDRAFAKALVSRNVSAPAIDVEGGAVEAGALARGARKGQLRRFCHRQRIDVPAEQRFAGECDLLRDALASPRSTTVKLTRPVFSTSMSSLAPAAGTLAEGGSAQATIKRTTSLPSRNTCA